MNAWKHDTRAVGSQSLTALTRMDAAACSQASLDPSEELGQRDPIRVPAQPAQLLRVHSPGAVVELAVRAVRNSRFLGGLFDCESGCGPFCTDLRRDGIRQLSAFAWRWHA